MRSYKKSISFINAQKNAPKNEFGQGGFFAPVASRCIIPTPLQRPIGIMHRHATGHAIDVLLRPADRSSPARGNVAKMLLFCHFPTKNWPVGIKALRKSTSTLAVFLCLLPDAIEGAHSHAEGVVGLALIRADYRPSHASIIGCS